MRKDKWFLRFIRAYRYFLLLGIAILSVVSAFNILISIYAAISAQSLIPLIIIPIQVIPAVVIYLIYKRYKEITANPYA